MLCVLTHRRLRPGAYEEFRSAWQPNEWWPAFRSGYHSLGCQAARNSS